MPSSYSVNKKKEAPMSTPKRFFIEKIAEEVSLEGEEFRHAKNVLRLGVGDEATLLDGSGREFSAVVVRAEKSRLIFHVVGARESNREPRANYCLLIGALKGDKTELVVQKAVELGVSSVIVFASRYCAAYMNENKLERLNKVSREAAKQCLRAAAPPVEYCGDFSSALEAARSYDVKLIACEFLSENEGTMSEINGSCAVMVGSEGGFCEEEFEEAKRAGFCGITLGRRILRAETAAIAVLSVIAHGMGELG